MSRSYKKTPICQDGYGDKSLQWCKRQSNKKVRKTKEIANKKAYQKVYETWNIRDYSFRKTLDQYKRELESNYQYFMNCRGNIEKLPKWISKEYEDKHFKCWKRYYYWK